MRFIIGWILVFWFAVEIMKHQGYNQTKESDYIINIPEPKAVEDTITYERFWLRPDTNKYKGKWVDVN
jgi:hypothetical protein